jgi:hypothetical protein
MSKATKTKKRFILDQDKIARVKKIVKEKTETEAINRALDTIIENSRIDTALNAVKGKGSVKDVYGRTTDRTRSRHFDPYPLRRSRDRPSHP